MVFKKVSNILAEILGIDDEDITPKMELTAENGVEALDIAKLVIECEKKFKVTIHDEDVHEFKCVEDIVKYIEKMKEDV